MNMIEGKYSHEGVTVKYKYRRAVGDRRALIVIFSGFRELGTYDFDGGPAAELRSNILWIQDEFDKNYAYYLCKGLNFDVENAVAGLIEKTIAHLGISRADCFAVGFSKGGSAALYYGIKYDLGAVVATAPQFRIGTYVQNHWPNVFSAMTVNCSNEERDYLDSVLPELIRKDAKATRNIYLFSSESDPQHEGQIHPFLQDLRNYSNFSYILTDSPLVTTHSAVTRYNVPLLVSLMAMLGEGARPVLGDLRNGANVDRNRAETLTLDAVRDRKEAVHGFTSLALRGATIYPEGYAFIKGYPADKYTSVRSVVRLSRGAHVKEVPLGGVIDPMLSTKFFENQYCDYSVGKFASLAHRGISLGELPAGVYDITLGIRHGEHARVLSGRSDRPLLSWAVEDGFLYKVQSDSSSASITKRSAFGDRSPSSYFKITGAWAQNSLVHFEGYFAVKGISAPTYQDVKYYLLICRPGEDHPMAAIPMASDHRSDVQVRMNDPWLDYSKAYFATPKYKGVDVGSVPPGQYQLMITARFNDALFTESLASDVLISGSFPDFGSTAKLRVGVIGSCASSDNFNSRLSPHWTSYFSLGETHYQSSFLSLMSDPLATDPALLDAGDEHSTRVTIRDFSKDYLLGLKSASVPDVLVLDFFTDARFGCVRVGESLVTNNEWKLYSTEFWKSLSNPIMLNVAEHGQEYLTAFRRAAEKFNRLREECFPNTRIVLNSARGVYSYIKNGARVKFSKDFVDQLNRTWAQLDEIFLSCVPADVISVVTSGTLGDADHPWGPAPYHYEAAYYRAFSDSLLQSLGYTSRAALAVSGAAAQDLKV